MQNSWRVLNPPGVKFTNFGEENKTMTFSFSNISSTAILIMVLYLTVAELVKYVRKNYSHSKK